MIFKVCPQEEEEQQQEQDEDDAKEKIGANAERIGKRSEERDDGYFYFRATKFSFPFSPSSPASETFARDHE